MSSASTPSPEPNVAFLAWVVLGSATQILATAFLIHILSFRNFAVGVAYSKTEVIQAAAFGLVFLGDAVTPWGAAAIAIGTLGVMLISLNRAQHVLRELLTGWTERPALIGLASGGLFGIAAVAFRAAARRCSSCPPAIRCSGPICCRRRCSRPIFTCASQTSLAKWSPRGGFRRSPACSAALWFMAMTIQLVAYVRTLDLIELVFTFAFSWFWFKERPRLTELIGIALLLVGIGMALNLR